MRGKCLPIDAARSIRVRAVQRLDQARFSAASGVRRVTPDARGEHFRARRDVPGGRALQRGVTGSSTADAAAPPRRTERRTPAEWLVLGLIIVVACAGKFGGSTLAARLGGLNWRDSAALGALMNTRGLMELIVLNIGLDLRVISPTLFAMMVLMALVTTFMTTPLLHWITHQRSISDRSLAKPAP
jgi:hypothetical protein